MTITETSVDELVDRENGALSDLPALFGGVAPDTAVGDGMWTAHDVPAAMLFYQRLRLDEAEAHGATVTGDRGLVERLLDACEAP